MIEGPRVNVAPSGKLMNVEDRELSRAVVTYVGKGRSPFPLE